MLACLLSGYANLLAGAASPSGMVKRRAEDNFEIGVHIAATPGSVIFQNEMMQLLQYTPTTETVYKRPILYVPPLVNKYYILDLQPKSSLIKWLVDQGHTVFVISWVNPGQSLADKGIWDYLRQGPIAALDAVELETGKSTVVNHYLMDRVAPASDLLFWFADGAHIPKAFLLEYARAMIRENLLHQPGGVVINGTPIDLGKVKVPVTVISLKDDHVSAGLVNPPAANKHGFWVNDELPETPQEWFDGAKKHEGSWWPNW